MSDLKFDKTLTLSFGVKDRHKSAGWYREHLACQLLYDVPEIGWTEIATPVPGVSIGFAEVMEVKEARTGGCVPVFGVKDIDTARASLESKGVKFDGETIVHDGMVKLVSFYDCDGHALMLAQNLQGS
ncbi:MAG: glyoxalase [Robiginitomaculum sp.]|nr:MAG: glyoxalase [Robiginitomaculum sp.]